MVPTPEFCAMISYGEVGARLHAFIIIEVHGCGSVSGCGRLTAEEISIIILYLSILLHLNTFHIH
jgi:hypothetical protein